jgi:hypothetical protein
MKKDELYYIVELEVALKNSKYVFGYVNISHIPYTKFEEIFIDQITNEQFIFDDKGGYIIDEQLYEKYKDFFDKEIQFGFDFNLFEYSVSLSADEKVNYKKNYYDSLPSPFAR